MPNPEQTRLKITGWQGRTLWNLAKDEREAAGLLSSAVTVVLGIRAVVQVIKDVWTGAPAGKQKNQGRVRT